MKKQKPEADFLFEISYEVCNKVGGIYRVLESKAANMVGEYGDNYLLIGPYYYDKNRGEFKQEAPDSNLQTVFNDLEKEGIKCYYGRWMVNGRPKVILIDFNGLFEKVNEIKKYLWEDYGIDSLGSDYSFEEPIVWSWAVGKVIEKVNDKLNKEKKVVAHFHEWLSGASILYLDKKDSAISTVFTTHATSLGRALAYNNVNFYNKFEEINHADASYQNNVYSKHQLERKAAEKADVFTTVSEITGLETEKFLGREPDVTLSNGLNLEKFLTFEEIVIKHRLQRRRLREFVISFFFPYYKFDIENTLFYFVIGRNEYKAKGVDVFIKSLSQLNQKLKEDKDNNKTVVAFFWIPTEVTSVKRQLVENKEFLQDVKNSLDGAMPKIEERILYSLLYEKEMTTEDIVSENYLFEIEKKLLRLNRENENPPLSTHDLADPNDKIINALREHNLQNKKEDPVKVVYYPIYLTGHDGLSNLNYQEALEACHLGVFPSFYEPWGYTPLEAAALGVASVTTDLAGFGIYRQKLEKKEGKEGVYVLKRYAKTDDMAINQLTEILHEFLCFGRKERVDNKIEARKIAAEADWKDFIANYIEAHNNSLK